VKLIFFDRSVGDRKEYIYGTYDVNGAGLTTGSCPKLNLATQAALRRVTFNGKALRYKDGITENPIIDRYDLNGVRYIYYPDSVTAIPEGAYFDYYFSRIRLGANVRLSSNAAKPSFDNGFDAFYNENGKQAGFYTYDDDGKTWSYSK
jgi:hypothetical protein